MSRRAIWIGIVVVGTTVGGWWSAGRELGDARAASPAAAAASAPAAAGAATDEAALQSVLEEVRTRTHELDQRGRELDQRAATLEALEEAATDAVAGLETRDGGRGTAPCRLQGGVARIYENMRPEDAAAILDQLDDETLRIVFARMEPRRVAAIMGAMSRERAVAFTRALTADPEPTPKR